MRQSLQQLAVQYGAHRHAHSHRERMMELRQHEPEACQQRREAPAGRRC
ncbi:hypothetical protein [Paenibacillus aquistagni]|uniref:Uncharacterized protein n=1 Tax=Paenibacillus aquistagni TaxID=1852522 RepID=A0A1X7I4G9_9BACL|nr:hypothetical protein [Paenibacillus aquistagni]NMM51762.1 hypothetical protein [Paenibacillus aquistagni]SMG08707.1 hypothetical protein SAMN06295960_0082 [Paenibacillus aquistagni]